MSVLQKKELEESPLADLHAIASELGLEGYRALRRDDLIEAILGAQGGEEGPGGGEESDEEVPEGGEDPAPADEDVDGPTVEAPPGDEEPQAQDDAEAPGARE